MKFRTAARAMGLVALAGWTWCAVAVGAATADGPYVLRNAGGDWEVVSTVSGESPGVHRAPLPPSRVITVPAVGDSPSFRVPLREPAPVSADGVDTAPRAPLFVVADTHGEYQVLVSMLRAHRVLGKDLEWTWGRGHLVLLGDVFDRGPHQLEILWLLYKLEAEARAAGGGAHLVLGNHETMVLRGDLRYLHPRYTGTVTALGVRDYSVLFAADTVLGQWLRTKPAVLRVNDALCLHGGISRALLDSTLTLAEINDTARGALDLAVPARGAMQELVLGSLGPLWYRGYFPEYRDFPPAATVDVDRALATFGVRRILVGHTIVPTLTPLYGGKVLAVQVNPKQELGAPPRFESLLIRDGAPWRATLDGRTEPLR